MNNDKRREGREPRVRIGQLAALTGVDQATIRTWEARYGVPVPERSEGGQRRYPPAEIDRVRAMRRFIEGGYRASEAARLAAGAWPGETPAGEGDGVKADLARLLTEGDLAAVRTLDRLVASIPIEEVILDVLIPIMREVGDRWESGTLSVAEEHAATALVTSWLGSQMRSLPPPLLEDTIVTAAVEGERHELGLVMLGMILRRQGARVLHLGSDLPVRELVAAVAARAPALVCLAGTAQISQPGLEQAVTQLQDLPSAPVVAVGGRLMDTWSPASPSITLPLEIRAAATRILEEMATRRASATED
ncbi:MAG: MerR family transcriptional regulator [Actinomycetota bacterium]|nr:MerR family transcriptional regulator [Actinomycetota bacterium]